MFGWISNVGTYVFRMVFPPPAPPPPPLPPQPVPGTTYGFQWQPGAGVPAVLQQLPPGNAHPGLYVAFRGVHLDGDVDPFGRADAGPGPVFAANPAAANAVTAIVANVARNPPDGEGGWRNPGAGRIANLGGFLAYVAFCLDLLNHTATGQVLLQRVTTGVRPC